METERLRLEKQIFTDLASAHATLVTIAENIAKLMQQYQDNLKECEEILTDTKYESMGRDT